MKYIGKVRLKKSIQMKKIAERFGLEDVVSHKTDDVTGIMKWRGGYVLVLLHLSLGDIDNVEKIRIFVHHLEDTETGEFFQLVIERFKGIALEVEMASDEISNMIKREIDISRRER